MKWHSKFSASLFLICLLEFTLWTTCTIPVNGAGADTKQDSHLFMKGETENLKHTFLVDPVIEAQKEQQQLNAKHHVDNATAGFGESVPNHDADQASALHDEQPTNHGLLMGSFIAVGLTILAVVFLFPHFTKKFLDYALHPVELVYLLRFKLAYKVPEFPSDMSKESIYCYEKLVKVSRSFAAVIAELPEELREPICNFYLVLRGLDTVEDDMSVDVKKKVVELRDFHKRLYQKGWNLTGYGETDEKDLLEQFENVIAVFAKLKPSYQEVIADITLKMGAGMAKFAEEKTVVTIEDYNEYCHYVAGLVGIGLSKMFACSGLETPKFAELEDLSNQMGLFLQKTNITRDYLEDLMAVNSRVFYPKDIWGKYGQKFEDLRDPKNAERSVYCLNEMVTDAIQHIPACLEYLSYLKDPNVFKFCSIPQGMAIATLARLYNNHQVFEKEVKIRKGEAVQIIMDGIDFASTMSIFVKYIGQLEAKIQDKDPNAKRLRGYIAESKKCIAHYRLNLNSSKKEVN